MNQFKVFIFWLVCNVSCAFAQDTGNGKAIYPHSEKSSDVSVLLPKNLEGRWSNPETGHSDRIEIEVLEMTGPRQGKAMVTFWPYCQKSETAWAFERQLKVWRFTATQCSNADQLNIRVRFVEGKNRMEGWYGSRDSEGRNTVYLEWK